MIAKHVAEWTRCQREQLRLCATLEQIAERLPLREVGGNRTVENVLIEVHRCEEAEIFPAIEAMSREVSPLFGDFRDHHSYDRTEAAALVGLLEAAEVPDVEGLRSR